MRYVVSSAVVVAAAAAVAVGGCSFDSESDADLVAGKQLFVQKCGSCHVLKRAATKGTTGPDLDQAFQQPQKEGFGESAIRGVVKKQIEFPRRGSSMPANLVTGDDVDSVAAYVARVVARPGQDTGVLATAVKQPGAGKPIAAKDGVLSIPADAGGQLAFASSNATAPAGPLTIEMPNESGVPHNIAIRGKGVGNVVENGVSKFSATFEPGTYTYVCTVPGHEQGGMVGKLTVK